MPVEERQHQQHEHDADAHRAAAYAAPALAAPILDVLATLPGVHFMRALLRVYGVRNRTPDFGWPTQARAPERQPSRPKAAVSLYSQGHYAPASLADLGAKVRQNRVEPRLHPSRAHGMLSEMARQAETASALGRNVAGFFRSGSGLSRAGWRVLRGAGVLAFAALAVFHVSLLWSRLADGQLLDSLRRRALAWRRCPDRRPGRASTPRRVARCGPSRAGGLAPCRLPALEREAGGSAVADDGQPSTSDLIFVVPSTAAAALVGLGLLVATFAASRVRRPALACLCTTGAERRWPDRLGMATVGARARSALPVRLTFAPMTTRVSRRIP